ncbi:MAG: translation elongation factor Ts [bacterium]|nr:translation elongation factor Ts [bacterium]
MVSIEQVKELREITGISVSECKKALEESGGDIGKAKAWLRERGKEIANKKSSREAGEGRVEGYVHQTGKVGVLLDLRCETDFVAKADTFRTLAHEVAMQIASMKPESIEELMEQSYIKDSSRTVKDLITEAVAQLGENIKVERFSRFEI